ncbi:MAG: P-loop NTPase fold protein, partial [Pseudomonadota bacterium]
MSLYNNDKPIEGTEDSPDLLNREAFAQHLAEILVLNLKDDCLTVSLEGEWGYGKTSVINLVKRHCQKGPIKPIIVEYNPWLGGKAEALIQDFLVQLSSRLHVPDRPKEALNAAKEVLSYSKLFGAMKFIPGAEPWASTVEQVFNVVGG